MNPLTAEQLNHILQDKNYKGNYFFKTVKGFPHPHDAELPKNHSRRTCIGIYASELRKHDHVFFQVLNNTGDIRREEPHLYSVGKNRHGYTGIVERNEKLIFEVAKCDVPMTDLEWEPYAGQQTIQFSEEYLMGQLIKEIKAELDGHRIRVESILSKYKL